MRTHITFNLSVSFPSAYLNRTPQHYRWPVDRKSPSIVIFCFLISSNSFCSHLFFRVVAVYLSHPDTLQETKQEKSHFLSFLKVLCQFLHPHLFPSLSPCSSFKDPPSLPPLIPFSPSLSLPWLPVFPSLPCSQLPLDSSSQSLSAFCGIVKSLWESHAPDWITGDQSCVTVLRCPPRGRWVKENSSLLLLLSSFFIPPPVPWPRGAAQTAGSHSPSLSSKYPQCRVSLKLGGKHNGLFSVHWRTNMCSVSVELPPCQVICLKQSHPKDFQVTQRTLRII